MSATLLIFKECIFNANSVTFMKRFTVNIFFFQIWKVIIYLPAIKAIGGVSSFDIPCISDENCTVITGATMCDTIAGLCLCAEGNVRMRQYHHCVQYADIGQNCQINEQCSHTDQNIICSTWTQQCRCRAGFEHRESNNNTRMCIKARHTENEPYIVHIFSGLDPVHIVLGCLTGGLALLACFAGIIQLVRKKYRRHRCDGIQNSEFSPDLGYSTTTAPSQSQPFSDSQYTTTPSGGDFACMNGNSTAPPTPGTLADEDYVVTPPPTYEEAVQSDREKAGSAITV